jgi:HNH endonuclease/AP2 domain
MLTQKSLKGIINYNPDTGIFTRIKTTRNVKSGDVAGHLTIHGYIAICVGGRKYSAHRLAWLYMTGEWPKDQIDHINCVRNDNRFVNLREATNSANQQNIKNPRSDNKSGLLGAFFDPKSNKYTSRIKINKKRFYIGTFNTANEAHQAYLNAKSEHHPFFMK